MEGVGQLAAEFGLRIVGNGNALLLKTEISGAVSQMSN